MNIEFILYLELVYLLSLLGYLGVIKIVDFLDNYRHKKYWIPKMREYRKELIRNVWGIK